MFGAYSQQSKTDSIPWHHFAPEESHWQGISLNEAYAFLKQNNRVAKPVIVAVIDSGFDTTHEDVSGNLWHNPKEIPYNNIDDDGNGYIDDYYGWNFIGGADGRNVDGETLESVRFYRENKNKYEGKKQSEIAKEQRSEYKLWLESQKEVLGKIELYQDRINNYTQWYNAIDEAEKVVMKSLDKDTLIQSDIKAFAPSNKAEFNARRILIFADSVGISRAELIPQLDYYNKQLEKKYNIAYNPRPDIVGDNPDDINDSIYGNSDIKAEGYSHGTGVSGIIAANRHNNIGTQGIADSVQLMILRVVPGGDERDKDVALAIKYAVNNGARIINCSFGKNYSKHPEFVLEAIDYAIAHDVLIVHAAGNNSENNDLIKHYPTPNENQRTHWIDVGASGQFIGNELAAGFTNYGKKTVDLFAPGVNIYSTSPGNQYRSTSGTSDAAPVVTGVAALILSYYPEITAPVLREILIESAVQHRKLKVELPGSDKKTKFKKLSTSGAIVNAYEAVMMSEKIQQEIITN